MRALAIRVAVTRRSHGPAAASSAAVGSRRDAVRTSAAVLIDSTSSAVNAPFALAARISCIDDAMCGLAVAINRASLIGERAVHAIAKVFVRKIGPGAIDSCQTTTRRSPPAPAAVKRVLHARRGRRAGIGAKPIRKCELKIGARIVRRRRESGVDGTSNIDLIGRSNACRVGIARVAILRRNDFPPPFALRDLGIDVGDDRSRVFVARARCGARQKAARQKASAECGANDLGANT